LLAELIIFLTLAGTTALLFRPLMAVINRNIYAVRDALVNRVEIVLKRPLRYGSMSPSLVGMVEIRDLRLGEDPDPLLALERIYLEYSFWNLVFRGAAASVRQILLERPEVFYDLDRDRDMGELLTGDGKGRSPALPSECIFAVENGKICIMREGRSLEMTGIGVEGDIRKGKITLNGSWRKEGEGPRKEAGISIDGSINGVFEDDLSGGGISLNLDSIDGRGFTVKNAGLVLSFSKEQINLKGTGDLPAFSALYLPGRSEFSGSIRADHFVPSGMVSFFGPLESFSPVLEADLSGTVSFMFRKSAGSPGRLEYGFNLRGDYRAAPGHFPLRAFALGGTGTGGGVSFSRCRFDFRRGYLGYEGDLLFSPLMPQGTLFFSGFSLTGDGAVNGILSFARAGSQITLDSTYLSLGPVSLSGLGGALIRKEGGGAVWNLFFRCLGKNDTPGTFSLKGTSGPGLFEGALGLDNFSAADMINITRPFFKMGEAGPWADKTSLTADIAFNTGFEGFSYTVSRFTAVYGEEAYLNAAVSGTERRLEGTAGSLVWQGGNVDFVFAADFSIPRAVSFNTRFSYLDYDYRFEGNLRDSNLSIRGSYGFLANIRIPKGAGWTGYASAGPLPVPYRGHRAYLDFDAAFYYGGPLSWNAWIRRLELRDFGNQVEGLQGSQIPAAAFLVQGEANQNGLNLDRIYYIDRYGPLEGGAAAVWQDNFSVVDASLFVSNAEETERLALDLFYDQGTLEFHGAASEFRMDRMGADGTGALLSGDLYGFRNRDGFYSVNVSIDSLRGRYQERDFVFSTKALLHPEELILSQVQGFLGETQVLIPYFSVDRAAGRLDTEGQVYSRVNGHDLGFALSMGIRFRPLESWLKPGGAAETFSGTMDVRSVFINDREGGPFSFVFSRTGAGAELPGIFRLAGGPGDMLMLEVLENFSGPSKPGSAADGKFPGPFPGREENAGSDGPPREYVFTAMLAAPSPVQGTITGTLAGGVIDALVSDVYIDMADLWEIIPINRIASFTGGFITGETRIYGSIFDPEFAGSAWGSEIVMAVPQYVAAEIGPAAGAITLEGSEISFGPLEVNCGSGGGVLEGWVSFNRWIPSFGLDITADRPIPVDFNISGLKTKGDVRGRLNLLMESRELFTITGNLDASDTEISFTGLELEGPEDTRDDRKMDVVAGIYVSAGRRVEFIWPNTEMPMIRAYGDAGSGLRIKGDTRIPHLSLDGTIALRGGELSYLQRGFYIKEGQIVFNGNDPQIDPRITVRAEIRDRNDEGPVTIAMLVDNTPLSSLLVSMPRFETTPALSQLEIYSLLGQTPPAGTAPVEFQNTRPLVNATIEMLLQTVVFRRVERQLRNLLKVDMFSFRTQILQNAFFEASRSREPEEQPSTIGNYLDNTAVYMGKYLAPDLFLEGMLSFRYDQYRDQYSGMRVEPEIGLELRTPLADVRWNVSPLTPENLFVDDMAVSLIWRWSL
jgi:hypothetical protein